MQANITIQQYIEQKGGTIEELCQYAQSKGFTLPQEPTYILSYGELSIIDPIYAEQLNYNYSNTNLTNSVEPKKQFIEDKQKDTNQSNRLIGLVKFFDSEKGFGFIVTNNAGINTDETGLVDFYVNSRDCKHYTPNEGDLVTFKRKNTKAVNVRKMKFDKSTLFSAMKYRGKYAKIEGTDIHSERTYDHSILAHIVKYYDNNKSVEIIEVFCDLLSSISDKDIDSVILQYIEDKELIYSLFARVYQSVDYFQNQKNNPSFVKLKKNVSDAIFEKTNCETLNLLPPNFDFLSYNTQIINLLIKCAESYSIEIKQWLNDHTLSVVDFSVLDKQDVNTIPIRLILSELSNSNSYISEIQIDWQNVCSYLKAKNNQIVFKFCKYYFQNAVDTFIDSHPIDDFIDDTNKIQYIKQLNVINETYWDAFVDRLFVSINGNVELMSNLPLSFVSNKLEEKELVEVVKCMIKNGKYDLELNVLRPKMSEQHIFDIIKYKFQKDCSDYLSSLTQSNGYDAESTFINNVVDNFKLFNDHNLEKKDKIISEVLQQFTERESSTIKMSLYKNDCICNIDVNFIIYYQDRFSTDEIQNFIVSEKINYEQKYKIAVSYMKYLLDKNEIRSMSKIHKCVSECFRENYANFENDWTANLSEKEKYRLWTDDREVIEKDFSYFLFDNLLKDNLSDYDALFNIKRLTKERIIDGLLNNLKIVKEIDNLPNFNKVYYHIYNLIKIDEQGIDMVLDFNNAVYNMILWHFDKAELFDFETLKIKFVYFNPSDQVRIIKKLFMLAETKKISLSIEMLDSLVRIDRTLFEIISKEKPEIPIDISVDVVIQSLCKFVKEHKFFYDKEIYDIILLNTSVNMGKYKNYNFKLKEFFDKCKGRTYYDQHIWSCNISYKTGIIEVSDNQFEITLHTGFSKYKQISKKNCRDYWEKEYTHNAYFDYIRDLIKKLSNRKWGNNKSKWIVPIDDNSVKEIKQMAKKYNMNITGSNEPLIAELTNNPIEYVYEKKTVAQRPGITFCEGRSVENKWEKGNGEPFYWCGNAMCFEHQVKEHSVEEWLQYTMFDFCRILGLNTDKLDTQGRLVKYGDYLAFVSIINRMNYMLDHLKCRSCGQMLMPNEISNYLTHMVTRFKCTTSNCSEYGKVYYISKCFNWKCYEIIDQREINRCPNGWFICKNCGSCCSTRIVKQRVDNCLLIGVNPSPYLLDFAERNLGHLEKREFYCHKCGQLTEYNYDRLGGTYKCKNCGVTYERWKYDYKQ